MDHLVFLDYFRELNMASILLRIFFCAVCGGAVGIERERRHRTAGFKTHVVVCMGAAICMMTGQYACMYFANSSLDPTRIGAQVVSGIGFLGVGTIIVTDNSRVKGLTTAAGLWVSACIGLAIGIGFYEIAILATIVVVLMFILVKQLKMFGVEKENSLLIYVDLKDAADIKKLIIAIREQGYSVFQMNMQSSKHETVSVIMGLHGDDSLEEKIIMLLSEQEYVVGFQEMDS